MTVFPSKSNNWIPDLSTITISLLSRKTALSVYFRNPRTSLEIKQAFWSIPIIRGSSNRAPVNAPFSNTETKAKAPFRHLHVSIITDLISLLDL
jgi:hypothetical protein